jgi:hypothetical protein
MPGGVGVGEWQLSVSAKRYGVVRPAILLLKRYPFDSFQKFWILNVNLYRVIQTSGTVPKDVVGEIV